MSTQPVDPQEQTVTAPGKPLVWKVPPWQAAVAFVVAAVAAGIAIYGSSNPVVRVLCAFVAILAVFGGVVAARAFLVVDRNGIGWRRLNKEVSVPWSEVDRVTVEPSARGNRLMVQVWRTSAAPLEIPPTLVLPSRPVGIVELRRRLHQISREITEYGQTFGALGR